MDLNRITLIGNVSKDPEQTELPSGATVTRLHVATNHSWKDSKTGEKKEKVNFHTVIAWNGLGNTMNTYLKKGDRMYVEGRLDNRTVEKDDGTVKYYTDIVAKRMIMLGGKKKVEESTEQVQEENVPEEVSDGKAPF